MNKNANQFTYQILISTYSKTDEDLIALLKRGNYPTNSIIRNQNSEPKRYEIDVADKHYFVVCAKDVGTSQNRNSLLSLSKADYIEFADDDMVFVDNADSRIRELLESQTKTNGICFTIHGKTAEGKDKKLYQKNNDSVRFRKISNAGVLRVFFKRNWLIENKLRFNQNIGPGTNFRAGEDTLFLHEFFKRRGKMAVRDVFLANIRQEQSSWFFGFDERYFYNRAPVIYLIYNRFWLGEFIWHYFKIRGKTNVSFDKAYRITKESLKDYSESAGL